MGANVRCAHASGLLPAEAGITMVARDRRVYSHKVHDNLSFPRPRGDVAKFTRGVADHEHVRPGHDIFQAGGNEFCYMRNVRVDVLTIGPGERVELDVAVIDA